MIGSFDQVNPGTAMDQKAALAGNTNSESGSYLVNREYQRRVEDIMRDGTPRDSAMQKETKTLDEVKGQHPWETPYLNQKQSERKT